MIRKTDFYKQEPKFYHIYGKCIHPHWFFVPQEKVWTYFCNCISASKKNFSFKIHCFVLMQGHFHGIIQVHSTERHNLVTLISERLSSQFTTKIQFTECIHLVLIPNIKVYYQTAKYIYNNPVEAGLCQHPWEYPYSSLSTLMNRSSAEKFPIEDNLGLILNPMKMNL